MIYENYRNFFGRSRNHDYPYISLLDVRTAVSSSRRIGSTKTLSLFEPKKLNAPLTPRRRSRPPKIHYPRPLSSISGARSRSRGDIYESPIGLYGAFEVQARKYNIGTDWFVETRTVPMDSEYLVRCDSSESISDVVSDGRCFHGVEHVKHFNGDVNCQLAVANKYIPSPSEMYQTWWVPVYRGLGSLRGSISLRNSFYPSNWPPSLSYADVDWSSLVGDVGDRLSGNMKTSDTLLVDLYEIGQTIEMFRNPFGLLTARWSPNVSTLGQLIKAGSNFWLEKKYGWDNFFRDMDQFIHSWSAVSKHIDFLNTSKASYTHVSKSTHVSGTINPDIPENPYGFFSISTGPLDWTCKSSFGVEILRGEHYHVLSKLDYLLQAVGAQNLPAAMWDALPFSFVVDWFVDIQKFLSSNPVFFGQYNLRNVGYSSKLELSGSMTITSASDNYFNGLGNSTSYTIPSIPVFKKYRRTPGFPPENEHIGAFGSLNLIHLVDGGALLAQRLL